MANIPSNPPHPKLLIASATKTGKMEYPDPKRSRHSFPTSLEGFGYKFIDGKLRNILSDEPFNFVYKEKDQSYNQSRYEALGEVITEEIYQLLESECGLVRLPVPCDKNARGGQGFIFGSKNWNTNERLMIFINGSGVVKAGQWARRLIINESLDSGTQIPFIKRAFLEGYDVLVLNTNQRMAPDASGNLAPVQGSSSASRHAAYVWENYVEKSAAEHIAIIAHSAGGCVTTDLYRQFKYSGFEKRVFAVAFTDSVHFLNSGKEFEGLIKVAVNWVSSNKPLDTALSYDSRKDVPRVSAGVNVHERTSWASFRSIFIFFHSKLQDRLGTPQPEIPFDDVPKIDATEKVKNTTSPKEQDSDGESSRKPIEKERNTSSSSQNGFDLPRKDTGKRRNRDEQKSGKVSEEAIEENLINLSEADETGNGNDEQEQSSGSTEKDWPAYNEQLYEYKQRMKLTEERLKVWDMQPEKPYQKQKYLSEHSEHSDDDMPQEDAGSGSRTNFFEAFNSKSNVLGQSRVDKCSPDSDLLDSDFSILSDAPADAPYESNGSGARPKDKMKIYPQLP